MSQFAGLKFAMPPCVSDKAKDCQRTFFGNFNQKNPFNENDSFKVFFPARAFKRNNAGRPS